MKLKLNVPGFAGSYGSTLVGMERNRYLICTAPPLPSLWAVLNEWNQIIVRYVVQGTVYGFKCSLLGVTEKPERLVFLSYPENIEVVNLRQHERVSCLIPGEMKLEEKTFRGALVDLSMGGCRFVFSSNDDGDKQAIRLKKEAYLSCQMPGLQTSHVLSMTVVSIVAKGRRVSVGGSFKELDPAVVDTIQNYLATAEALMDDD
jgi:c-di-GMP-binding flagellar brake protein YcgR